VGALVAEGEDNGWSDTSDHPFGELLIRDREEIGYLFVLAQEALPEIFPARDVLAVIERALNLSVPIFEPKVEDARALLEPDPIHADTIACDIGENTGRHLIHPSIRRAWLLTMPRGPTRVAAAVVR